MVDYYDYVLALIPIVFAGTTAAAVLAGLSLTAAIPAGSVGAVSLIGHAMFVRSPEEIAAPSHETRDAPARTDDIHSAD
ncbi:MAG: hypothetical protein ABEH56_02635 [Salinirussus sp.]